MSESAEARVRALLAEPRRLIATALALFVIVGCGFWLLRPEPTRVEDHLPVVGTPAPAPMPAEILVQVAGAVEHPGVYRVVPSARLIDVIDAAGGASADADVEALTLAAVLHDGDRVYVPKEGEAVRSTQSGVGLPGAPATPTSSTPIDLNRADVTALDALPGVGPSTAQAIVAYREEHGAFASVDELLEVRGIGPAKLDAIKELLRV